MLLSGSEKLESTVQESDMLTLERRQQLRHESAEDDKQTLLPAVTPEHVRELLDSLLPRCAQPSLLPPPSSLILPLTPVPLQHSWISASLFHL